MFKKLFGAKHAETGPSVPVQFMDMQIDLFPIAEEVLELAPEPTGMSAMKLATLAKESFNGEYIRVAEYPEDVDREYAKLVIRRVQQWASWKHREKQLKAQRPKDFVLDTEADACERMRAMHGESCSKTGFKRLPLDGCWQRCFCHYRISRTRRHR